MKRRQLIDRYHASRRALVDERNTMLREIENLQCKADTLQKKIDETKNMEFALAYGAPDDRL